ncbi:MAG: glycosyltransferase family 39 protein, partial [Gammaproteobacteria bacterium]
MQDSSFRELDLGFCALIGVLPAIVFWLTTPWGIGAAVDSVSYFQMAEIFLNADTLVGLGTHFPPLYPYLISLFTAFTDDISTAARILQCVLLALNGILAAVLVSVLTDRDRSAIFFIVLALTLRSEVFFLWHYAMSESLFTAILLAHYLCLVKWHRTQQAGWVFIAGLLLGMIMLTRYAGLIFSVISVFVVAVQCRNLKTTKAFRQLGAIILGVGSVTLSWYLIAQAAGLQRAPRAIGLYPIGSDNLELGLD